MSEFRMPSLGADMDTGTIVEWRVAVGDTVQRGDIVAVVGTEKSDIEVEIWEPGVVERLLVPEGESVAVGTPIAVLTAVGGAARAGAEPPTPEGPDDAAATSVAPTEPPPAPASAESRVHSPLVRHLADDLGVDLSAVRGSGPGGTVTRADVERAAGSASVPLPPAAPPPAARPGDHPGSSPLARRRASELGVDLASIVGRGPDGAITLRDVEQAAAGPDLALPAEPSAVAPPSPGEVRGDAASRAAAMRQAIGRLMARSKREIPHYYLEHTIDLEPMLTWLEARNADAPVDRRLLPAAVLLKATALTAVRHPDLNGFWVDDSFQAGGGVHLGVAIALRGGGLIAPALHDADVLGIDDLMAALRDLVERTRNGRLRSSEMSDATLTVTNLGEQGAEAVHGVIYPPQVALVGFGGIAARPWAADGMLGVHRVVRATLAADHRATDGHVGSRFLTALDHLLHTPEDL